MEKDLGIKNKVDLYKRLLPALNCKVRELEKLHILNIKKEDIWNYLIKEKWDNIAKKEKEYIKPTIFNQSQLHIAKTELSEMVDDILNLDNDLLFKFKNSKDDNFVVDDIVGSEIEVL